MVQERGEGVGALLRDHPQEINESNTCGVMCFGTFASCFITPFMHMSFTLVVQSSLILSAKGC